MRGLWKYLSPFAPDQSGAVSVLYRMGGIIVICDAGGCAGNVCGFDEPRWFTQKSAIFSAGLRDMDAILGRDDRLVAKLRDTADKVDAKFAAIVGTPVPAVIGTDYRALGRMAERKTGLPVLTVDTNGMALYDTGAEKALLALLGRFARERLPVQPGRVGVLGMTPLDFGGPEDAERLTNLLRAKGANSVCCYGMTGTLEDLRQAPAAEWNLVVSPAGLKAAQLLKREFGTPYTCDDPLAEGLLPPLDYQGKRALVIHQQVRANALRAALEARGCQVTVGSWFSRPAELVRPGDLALTGEDQLRELLEREDFDLLLGDRSCWAVAPGCRGQQIDLPHFAVSGRLG